VRQIFISLFLVLATVATAWAQDVSAVEQQIERLRAQLREVADREVELQRRARQLDEDLRPENVERSLLGIGTTDARAVRDRRREQLERQKTSVNGQLTELAASRAKLEATIAMAEAEAVRLRAASLGANNAGTRDEPAATPAAPAAAPVARRSNVTVRKSRPRRRIRSRRRS
jgi:cell division protein FtsB